MTALARIEEVAAVNPILALNTRKSAPTAERPTERIATHEVDFLLRGLGTVVDYSKGDVITIAGGNANGIYKVLTGAVSLWRSLPNEKRQIVDFRLPGEWFGVIRRPAYVINAEATCDCSVGFYRRGYVDGICESVPSFLNTIARLIADAVPSRREIALRETGTAKERIAEFLLSTVDRAAKTGQDTLPFSIVDIGERIDSPPEFVARALDVLISAGAIAATGNGLKVIDPTRLQAEF